MEDSVKALDPSGDQFAARLRGFGPFGVLAIVVIVLADTIVKPLSGILVLLWAWRSHTPWREIGYVRPRRWIADMLVGIVFGFAFKVLMKTIVMPLLGADPINQPYHFLVGNAAALPATIFMSIAAGFGEETVFRGYLFERLGKLLGTGVRAKASIVLLTSALFAMGHYANLGVPGVEQAVFTGLVFGTIFAIAGRLWLLMWAHAAFDLTALAIIYCDIEADVAHLVFK